MNIKTYILIFLVGLIPKYVVGQNNCNVFLWDGDSCRYKACKYLEDSPKYFQLTKEYHEIKDKALEICPEYAVVYKHKSTAYLKTGDFINWKILIDKAVALNPEENLDYRAWCRFQFFRDYKGAIEDIEELDRIVDQDLGYCQNGDYHLNVAKGLFYKMLGNRTKAIEIIESQIKLDSYAVGLYDYLHLGVMYLENNELEKAMGAFQNQLKTNELAECHYYLALTYKKMKNQKDYVKSINKAKTFYLASSNMMDIYTHHVDKVFLKDIQNELDKLEE